ncbi:MAG TPA: T9SS type A sorting domain-containing protein [Ignavibacteriaceae bacterium]|nr:T9SS type A sorting domain-containing protein [Ignavibacteriaceae bacterium]
MKKLLFLFTIIFLLQITSAAQQESQKVIRKYQSVNPPMIFQPKTHPQGVAVSTKSFYKLKANWQKIIDSTWGTGLPLNNKLAVFDSYESALSKEFDGFNSLGLDWDSLKNVYRSMIDSTTSRGRFSSIMTQFAYSLRDCHTRAMDTVVILTPLSPGVPILILNSFASVEHFGAVLTALPDTTALVLKTIVNHPLGLEPGDVILGYEGKPWWNILQELLEAKLPINGWSAGSKSAEFDHMVRSVGMNWHLFDTIDVRKYSTKQIQHLSVSPLLSLPTTPLFGNEQLDIPGISSAYCYGLPLLTPDISDDWGKPVSFGKINGTDIGYIQIVAEWPPNTPDQPFREAIDSLWKTNGLIIDLRWNIGGWSFFKDAFAKLFNQKFLTIEDAYRSGPSSWSLKPFGNSEDYSISGSSETFYDHPIAVLLGPTCESMGDIIAQWFRYHPMVRFFGKPPVASMGDNKQLSSNDWVLLYSISDMFHVNQPGVYLNRSEFPIDFPVWHNPDDAALGKDAVVETALNWMNNLVYGHDIMLSSISLKPAIDTLKISALIENPNSHQTSSKVYIKNLEGSFVDSLQLTKSGLSGKSEIWTGNYTAPDSEDFFNISLSAKDITDSKTWTTNDISRFTTVGPVTLVLDSMNVESVAADRFILHNIGLANNSAATTIKKVTGTISTNDTIVSKYYYKTAQYGDLAPGKTKFIANPFSFQISSNQDSIEFQIDISTNGEVYWSVELTINFPTVGIKENVVGVPTKFNLEQNYPNPFNPSTKIKYSIPFVETHRDASVQLKIYDVLGREVTTIVNETKAPGKYEIEFNASSLSSGVYFYQLKAGKYIQTKKMMLIK